MKISTPEQVEIRIPRRAEFVRVARLAACAVASQMEFTYDVIQDVALAIGEACANAVEHVADASCEEVLVRFTITEERLTMEVFDRGQGFDPEETRATGQNEIDEPGGLGLLVIRELMDEMQIECDPKTGTCVRMVKYRAEK